MRHFPWTVTFVICPTSRVSRHDDKPMTIPKMTASKKLPTKQKNFNEILWSWCHYNEEMMLHPARWKEITVDQSKFLKKKNRFRFLVEVLPEKGKCCNPTLADIMCSRIRTINQNGWSWYHFSQEKTHHPPIPVIIYSYYRKYAIPLFLGHPVLWL